MTAAPLLDDAPTSSSDRFERILSVDVHVHVDGEGRASELAGVLERAVDGGPFRLAAIELVGPRLSRCRFEPVREGLVLGYRNVIALQSSIDRVVRLLGVSCAVGAGPRPRYLGDLA